MLVIRRKPGESILIGSNIEIRITDISHGRVKVGITAPADVFILRKEIWIAQQENVAAAKGVTTEAIQALISRFRRA